MKLILLYLLVYFIKNCEGFESLYRNLRKNDVLFERNQILGRCIGFISEEYFWRKQYVAIILVTGNRNRCEVLGDNQQQGAVNQIVRVVGKHAAILIVNDPIVDLGEVCENYVVIVDTFRTLQASVPDIPAKKYSHSGRVVIVVTNPPKRLRKIRSTVQDILDICWENDIVNVAVVVTVNGVPELFTYFPFLEGECRNSDAVRIAAWDNATWSDNRDLYPPKASQMNGCELRVSLVARFPHTLISYSRDGKIRWTGVEANLLRMIAVTLNFSLVESEPSDKHRWGFFNGTAWTGVVGDLVYRRADIGAGSNIPSLSKMHILDISVGYDTVYLVWAIPRYEKYSPFVKMLLPFKYKLWFFTVFTVLGLLLLFKVLMVSFDNSTVRARSVTMSIWQITFGYPVDFMPPGRFASYVFAVWIWGSMVLRNSYQGGLVGFLTSTFYADGVYTLRDMVEQDFDFYGLSSGMDYIKNVTDDEYVKRLSKKIILLDNVDELDDKIAEIYQTNEKAACFSFGPHINELNYKFGIHVQKLKEIYRSQTITLAFRKYTLYKRGFDNLILKISEAGFIEQWLDDFSYPDIPPENDPVQIKLQHLLLPFILLLFGECIAFFIFIAELVLCKNIFKQK